MKGHPTAWARARLRAPELDRELARGVPSALRPELTLRAELLTSPRERGRLAWAIEAVVDRADTPLRRFRSRVPVRSADVRDSRIVLLNLAARLDSDHPVDVQGVALASLLLRDGASPLYLSGASPSLYHATRAALLALELLPSDVTHG